MNWQGSVQVASVWTSIFIFATAARLRFLSWPYRDKPGLVGFGFLAILAIFMHAHKVAALCMQRRGFCGSEHSRLVYLRLFLLNLDSAF
ncbi:hypothetical protein M441DRAFT_60655 [Trichoderma asperellum CBS 433.97]|uniref:Uncharacterized protein n=1 Tax=Trichoderma asperellum (strain ATCC 204424 / CBS 433.97 / NBRC 101777) TaxID=1042311 RepID=A0A2T3Z0U2_TRIA4|nr:hypothetical protein M441DRAFT_60655 [Trichoderma asperellum CBS 433.97]PTB38431.1 hypothetical protein M441DRAFT_60655 [Trichoderma asperellum CBS 433.97]